MDLDRKLNEMKAKLEDLLSYFELTERLLDQAIAMSHKVGHYKMEAIFQVIRKVLDNPEATGRLFIAVTDFVDNELSSLSNHDKERMRHQVSNISKEKVSEKFGYEVSEEEYQSVKTQMINTLNKL